MNTISTSHLADSEVYDYLIKLLIIGDSGVGKTNMLLRFCEDKFLTHTLSTIGVDFKKKVLEIEGKKLKLQVWDTAGQERFQTIALSYYKGAWGIILSYSIADRKSFESIGKWMKQIKENAANDVLLVLVGNKNDLENQRVVSKEEGEKLAKEQNMPFYETSAKEDMNIKEVFMKIGCDILNKINSCEKSEVLENAVERSKSHTVRNFDGNQDENNSDCAC